MSGDPYGEGQLIDFKPRCWRCNKLLAEYATRPWRARCVRCKALSQAGDAPPGVSINEPSVGDVGRPVGKPKASPANMQVVQSRKDNSP